MRPVSPQASTPSPSHLDSRRGPPRARPCRERRCPPAAPPEMSSAPLTIERGARPRRAPQCRCSRGIPRPSACHKLASLAVRFVTTCGPNWRPKVAEPAALRAATAVQSELGGAGRRSLNPCNRERGDSLGCRRGATCRPTAAACRWCASRTRRRRTAGPRRSPAPRGTPRRSGCGPCRRRWWAGNSRSACTRPNRCRRSPSPRGPGTRRRRNARQARIRQ